MKKELEANHIEISFSGFFDEAINLLKKWIKGKESKNRLEEECAKIPVKVNDLKRGLEAYDSKYEKIFTAFGRAEASAIYEAPYFSAAL